MRGKRLFSPKGENTRPTGDRVKEGLFSAIQFETDGARVLDLFSGSGQLSLEALSRGAQYAVLCESDREAADVIKKNIEITRTSEKITLISSPFEQALNNIKTNAPYDIVFIDPPYKSNYYEKALNFLNEGRLLSEKAVIICETKKKFPLPQNTGDFEIKKVYNYGSTSVTIYRKREA